MSNVQRGLTAAIGSALVFLSVLSGTQAQACEKQPGHRAIYNSARGMAPPNPESQNNPTWPEGAPDYHGSNGG
jgi:hypothetical protein